MDSSSPLLLIAQLNAKNEVSVFLMSPTKIDESENSAKPTSQQQSQSTGHSIRDCLLAAVYCLSSAYRTNHIE